MTAPQIPGRQLSIAPWGVAVADVAVLCTTVPIRDAQPDGARPTSTVDILVATVQSWIREVSTLVQGSIGQYERIIDDHRAATIIAAAKTVVVNGVASYVVDAAFPSAATPNTTSYGQILWQRYKDGLLALTDLIGRWISEGGDGVAPGPGAGSGAVGSFPTARFPDGLAW